MTKWVAALCLVMSTTYAQPRAVSAVEERVEGIGRAIAFSCTIEGQGTYGAGVLLDPLHGFVLTNWHVVEHMTDPRVTFSDGAQADAKVIDHDERLDVALLRVPPQDKRPTPIAGNTRALHPGEELYAVGNPRHLGFTVSRGIVSFVGREVEGARYVQTDLPINEGNSGGPMINARGELVGIMTFVLKRAQGLSFALPIEAALARFSPELHATRSMVSGNPSSRR